MAQITPYLHFDGNCRDGMTFYQECLGGNLVCQTVGDTPAAEHMPAEARQKIIHAALTKDGMTLLASDMLGPGGLTRGNSVSISLLCTSEEEVKTLFSKLSAGGNVTNPLADQFWGAIFGTLTDKFGFHWMLNYDKSQPK